MASAAQRAKEAFGSRLREIRLDAGLTGRQLADLAGFHFTKVSRVEHGAQGLSDADIRAWCSACGADDQIPGLIAQARAVDSMYREWKRQARSGLRRLQETIEPLYERTRLFRIHEHWSIPGLLQTAAYSTESMAYWASLLDLPDDRDAATAARLDRQRVLRSGNHRFQFLLAEQTLRTRIGTAEDMVEQLDRVLGVMTLPNVSIGIIPATAGLGAHTQTAFWIFDNDLVKVETLTAALDITRPDEIEIYVTMFDQMRQAAKFRANAKALIIKARDELLQ
ncbi:MAG TPA: XRE family transcriptional regulator [Actinobacteria bacterium]|nr:XRE family transcriptional regulator [Actinomycetota bacterium]